MSFGEDSSEREQPSLVEPVGGRLQEVRSSQSPWYVIEEPDGGRDLVKSPSLSFPTTTIRVSLAMTLKPIPGSEPLSHPNPDPRLDATPSMSESCLTDADMQRISPT